MNQATRLKPLFHPGKLLITPAALAALRANGVPVISILLRHIAGDWGLVSEDDKHQNDVSITAGLRLISIYRLPDQTRILVTTEWNRSNTTIECFDDVVPRCDACSVQYQRPADSRHSARPVVPYVKGTCA